LRRPPGAEAGRQIAGETERQQSRGESEQCFHKRQLTGRPSASFRILILQPMLRRSPGAPTRQGRLPLWASSPSAYT
jgi:hypothetical protein